MVVEIVTREVKHGLLATGHYSSRAWIAGAGLYDEYLMLYNLGLNKQ